MLEEPKHDDESDNEPPEVQPIIKSKRPHEETEELEQDLSHVLKKSKAGKAFTDLGFTFEPGQNERHPDTCEIKSASVYFSSKDVVKRTKRLNINKKYKYDEEGNICKKSWGSKNKVKLLVIFFSISLIMLFNFRKMTKKYLELVMSVLYIPIQYVSKKV